MYSPYGDVSFPTTGCPIRKSSDQSLLGNSPKLIAAFHVLHRSPAPRHQPYALSSLNIVIQRFKARSEYVAFARILGCPKHLMHLAFVAESEIVPLSAALILYLFLVFSCQRTSKPEAWKLTMCVVWVSGPMVEPIGIEPTTSGLQSPRSPN